MAGSHTQAHFVPWNALTAPANRPRPWKKDGNGLLSLSKILPLAQLPLSHCSGTSSFRPLSFDAFLSLVGRSSAKGLEAGHGLSTLLVALSQDPQACLHWLGEPSTVTIFLLPDFGNMNYYHLFPKYFVCCVFSPKRGQTLDLHNSGLPTCPVMPPLWPLPFSSEACNDGSGVVNYPSNNRPLRQGDGIVFRGRQGNRQRWDCTLGFCWSIDAVCVSSFDQLLLISSSWN